MKHENRLIIYKKVAKQGAQAVIVVPKILEKKLRPGTLAKLTIDILEEVEGSEND